MSNALRELPVEAIKPDPDQPRKQFDEAEDAAFIESVKQHGIITPIAVRPNGKGFIIVAGERRWRAAKAAKLTTIPAKVSEPDSPLVAATVENVMRQDLNPVEEGHAYLRIGEGGVEQIDAEAVAKLVSRPVERIRDRLSLTTLPQEAQDKIVAGAITLPAARLLVTVTAISPDLATALAWGVGTFYDSDSLARSPAQCLRSLHGDAWVKCGDCKGFGYVQPNGKPFKDEAALDATENDPEGAKECPTCDTDGQVREKVEGVPSYFALSTTTMLDAEDVAAIIEGVGGSDEPDHGKPLTEAWAAFVAKSAEQKEKEPYGYIDAPQFQEGVTDAARSYGCLVEFDRTGYVTDPVFAAEYATPGIVAATEQIGKQRRAHTAKAKASASGQAELTPEQQAEREQRKREREAAEKARVKAEAFNLDLGAALTTRLAKPRVTTEAMKLLVGALLDSYLTGERDWGPCSGLAMYRRFTEEPAERDKKGKAKYLRKHDAMKPAAEQVWREFKAARSPEEVLGVLLRALGTAAYTDLRGLMKADMEGCSSGFPRKDDAEKLLAKLLPKPLVARAPKKKGRWTWNG